MNHATTIKAIGHRQLMMVAVVVWLGYDAPQGWGTAVARSERASAGAEPLRRFVAGLPRTASTTLLCHSYGAVVCGHAAAGIAATDLVALAAPGLDVSTVEALRTGARVWVARIADDPIRQVAWRACLLRPITT